MNEETLEKIAKLDERLCILQENSDTQDVNTVSSQNLGNVIKLAEEETTLANITKNNISETNLNSLVAKASSSSIHFITSSASDDSSNENVVISEYLKGVNNLKKDEYEKSIASGSINLEIFEENEHKFEISSDMTHQIKNITEDSPRSPKTDCSISNEGKEIVLSNDEIKLNNVLLNDVSSIGLNQIAGEEKAYRVDIIQSNAVNSLPNYRDLPGYYDKSEKEVNFNDLQEIKNGDENDEMQNNKIEILSKYKCKEINLSITNNMHQDILLIKDSNSSSLNSIVADSIYYKNANKSIITESNEKRTHTIHESNETKFLLNESESIKCFSTLNYNSECLNQPVNDLSNNKDDIDFNMIEGNEFISQINPQIEESLSDEKTKLINNLPVTKCEDQVTSNCKYQKCELESTIVSIGSYENQAEVVHNVNSENVVPIKDCHEDVNRADMTQVIETRHEDKKIALNNEIKTDDFLLYQNCQDNHSKIIDYESKNQGNKELNNYPKLPYNKNLIYCSTFIKENAEHPKDYKTNEQETFKTFTDMFKGNFEWDQYLEETTSESAPPTAFMHIEHSLETGVKVDQCLEVMFGEEREDVIEQESQEETNWTSFWPAKVISSCGSLLRLRYLGTMSESNSFCALEFWREVSSSSLKPVGWSLRHNVPMVAPSKNEDLILHESSLVDLEAAPAEAFKGFGTNVSSWIIEGSILEVISINNPYEGSIFKVVKNIGGRLLIIPVESQGEEGKGQWIFFIDRRVKPYGWIDQKGHPYRYIDGKSDHLKTSLECATERALSYVSSCLPPLKKHSLEPETYLEAILPTSQRSIHVAKVSRIIDDTYFELSASNVTWVTWIGDPLIMPPKFSDELYLDLIFPQDYLGKHDWGEFIASNDLKAATCDLFPQHIMASELGFEEGQKLEAVSPLDPDKICIATVERVLQHLLLLKLDFCNDCFFFRSSTSTEIFPVGWMQSNLYQLSIPSLYAPSDRKEIEDQEVMKLSEVEQQQSKPGSECAVKLIGNSMWCPRLFINHFCYPGPYLSKTKVAKMSRSVGPGPVPLVLRDVISMTINSGYIPTRVLRELQSIQIRNSSWQSIPMKAKFKRHILKAGVNIPSAARDIEDFLVEFSKILMCCRNMWSFDPLGENCPLVCNKQSLSIIASGAAVFRGRGTRGSMARRKKGGKKRLFYPIKSSVSASDDPVEEDCEPDEGEEVEDVVSGSEGESRSTSPISSDVLRKPKPKRSQIFADFSIDNKVPPDNAKDRCLKRSKSDTEAQQSSEFIEIHRRKRPREGEEKSELMNAIFGLEPAVIKSDPLEWSVDEVEEYLLAQTVASQQVALLKEQEVDGRALLLLNLPSLICHLGLSRDAAVALAHHICKVKLAHFLYYYPEET